MGLLFRLFGRPIRGFIEGHFNLLSLLFTLLLIGGFLVVRYWNAIAELFRALA